MFGLTNGSAVRVRLITAGVGVVTAVVITPTLTATSAAGTAPSSESAAGSPALARAVLPRTDCLTSVPNVFPQYLAAIPAYTRQVIVSRGVDRRSADNLFERWQKVGDCWQNVGSVWSYNGANGWHVRPWSGSLRSPIGVFSLTDAGGRLPNPGTTLRYHYGPARYERGGYKIDYPVQLYNYVVAINYNRRIGKPPRDERQPDKTTGSGYWIHQRGLGVTRGCLSLTKSQLRVLLQWLNRADRPYIVMGPQATIGGLYEGFSDPYS
ncbi:MAG: L,D-transpeptidase family protein [Actinomycetes bacterium]